jgi:protein involved in polysaccharide export with SLBB domain
VDKAVFWSTKSPLAEYRAITFEHPEFDAPIRLVANQFAPVTLAGQVHTPAPMTIRPPEAKGDSQPRLTIAFPRQVVGRQFKQQLRLIAAAGSREPITVTYSQFLGVVDVPQQSIVLYVSDAGGVSFNADSVQVTATDDNPMRRPACLIYEPGTFTGLDRV